MPLKLFTILLPLLSVMPPALAHESIHLRAYSDATGEGTERTEGTRGSAPPTRPMNELVVQTAPSDSIRGNTVYFGAGASLADTSQDNSIPFSIGYMYRWRDTEYFVGVDIAGEGVALDNTSGRTNVPRQAMSTNFIFGPTWDFQMRGPNVVGAGFLFGFRTTDVSCPDSYLGFRCYADQTADLDFSLNAGLVVHWAVPSWLFGIRLTTESGQITFGFNF